MSTSMTSALFSRAGAFAFAPRGVGEPRLKLSQLEVSANGLRICSSGLRRSVFWLCSRCWSAVVNSARVQRRKLPASGDEPEISRAAASNGELSPEMSAASSASIDSMAESSRAAV